MLDLTQTAPRSVGEKLLGIVQLARTIDKAKAVAHGCIGEYHFDCSMDRVLFEYLGMNSATFFNIVKIAKADAEIEKYARTYVVEKDPRSIEAFNTRCLSTVPSGESLARFNELRAKIAPLRTDITTWPDLLDLDEGRLVPLRKLRA